MKTYLYSRFEFEARNCAAHVKTCHLRTGTSTLPYNLPCSSGSQLTERLPTILHPYLVCPSLQVRKLRKPLCRRTRLSVHTVPHLWPNLGALRPEPNESLLPVGAFGRFCLLPLYCLRPCTNAWRKRDRLAAFPHLSSQVHYRSHRGHPLAQAFFCHLSGPLAFFSVVLQSLVI